MTFSEPAAPEGSAPDPAASSMAPSSGAPEDMGPAYEALIVDYGGVLTTPLQEAMIRFSSELGIELQDLVRAALIAYSGGEDDLVTRFETGHISEEDFAHQFAARLSSLTGKDVPPEGLVSRIFSGLDHEHEMFDAVLAARRAGFKTALLSNSWGTSLYPKDRFPQLFDAVVISGEVGLRKPDPAIFDMTTERLAVAPSACIFVDDHPGHLKAAAEVGMTTVLHRTPADTIAELETLLGVPLR